MPAKSKAQQRFMGMVHAYKKGELKGSEVSKAIKKAAKGMKKKTAKDYASTKHTDKPERVKSEAKERDYKAEYKKFQSSTKSKKYRAELNKYNRQKGTYGNGDGKDASHKGGKIAGFEKESTNRGRREKSRLKKETVNEAGLEMNKLKDAIKMFQKKIKKQGRVTNARDEEHLKNLIKFYKQMGGKGVKESVSEDHIKFSKEEMAQLHKDGKIEKGGHTIEFRESVNEGKKRFKVGFNIGKAKYVISHHDGREKHKDGSDFFGISIYKNQKAFEKGQEDLKKKGYIEESVNESPMAPFSSSEAKQHINQDIKKMSKHLGKASQQSIKIMMDGVKSGKYTAMDISRGIKEGPAGRAHFGELGFLQQLWNKVRDGFRRYTKDRKLS